ncbi:MAG: hypothetical protein ACTHLB_05435 [Parafilimonas sp.]
MNKLLIILLLLLFSCRAKKINRTAEKKDSVVTAHVDSSYLHVKEQNNDSSVFNSYDKQTKVYFKKDSANSIVISTDGTVSFTNVDSVVVKEKSKSKIKTTQQTKTIDSGQVSSDTKAELHTQTKTVNKDIKAGYTWMYIIAFIGLVLFCLALIVYKFKDRLKL